jgi:stage V sporulation protein G
MEITEVRIKLMEDSEDRLRAFCSITIDHSFVIRDLKIIEGSNGPFVAMPSRKLSARCGRCGNKNHLRSLYCNQCGARLRGMQDLRDVEGGNANKLYADIAHPINQECRDLIQQSVIGEYALELERAKLPGYKSRYDDEYTENTPVQEPSKNTGNAPRPNMIDRDPSAKQSPSNSPSENQSWDSRDFGNGIF